MKRYFIEIAYNGTAYCGWQVQPNEVTVQSTIQDAISTIFNAPHQVTGCGRTDSGVHASQFFLHFDTTLDLPENFLYRFTKFLPKDISAFRIFECEKHARYDATYRAYDYYIHFEKNPFLEPHSFLFPWMPLDIPKMRQAFALMRNYTDFKPFEKSKSASKTSLCHLYENQIIYDEQKQRMQIHIAANRFLRGMVRRVVGTLIMVGKGKITLEEFKDVMETKGQFSINNSAPAQGLFLSDVRYEDFCYV